MLRKHISGSVFLLCGLLVFAATPAAAECEGAPAAHLYGWYADEQNSVWLYPSAEKSVGLFRATTQQQVLPDRAPEAGADEIVFGGKWRLTWTASNCRRPEKVILTDMDADRRTVMEAVTDSHTVRDIRFSNGAIDLGGLALVPQRPRAAITIVHGNGTSDRDNGAYLAIADALARRGFAVLLPDKRGSGLSKGDWRTVGFDALADDALAGLRRLEKIAGKLPGGLLTVSQGGWVGAVAAADAPGRIDFVVNLVGPAVTLAEQQKHLLDRMIADQGFDDATAGRIHDTRQAAQAFLKKGTDENWDRYVTARNALLETPAAPLAGSFPDSRDAWNWAWGRRVSHVDPVPLIEESARPYLVIYGQDDRNVAVAPNTRRIVRSDAMITLLVLPGRGHNLADPDTGIIDSFVFDTMGAWISGRLP